MRRRDDELEDASLLRLKIELAVLQDIGLDALEDTELAAIALVQAIDFAVLAADVFHAHPARDRQPIGMIGHPHAGMTERPARRRHRLDALAAVAPRRVHLEITAERRLRHDGVL